MKFNFEIFVTQPCFAIYSSSGVSAIDQLNKTYNKMNEKEKLLYDKYLLHCMGKVTFNFFISLKN